MKTIITTLIVAILFYYCSNHLSNSKAEGIISDCLETNTKYHYK